MITTSPTATASEEFAAATLEQNGIPLFNIDLWMNAITVDKNTASGYLGTQSVNVTESADYVTAGGDATIAFPQLGPSLDSQSVMFCGSGDCAYFESTCNINGSIAGGCQLWYQALAGGAGLGVINDAGSYIGVTLNEPAVRYAYNQPVTYALYLYQGGDNGVSYYDGTTSTQVPNTAGKIVNAFGLWSLIYMWVVSLLLSAR